jgi:hypothetical protein
MKYMIEFRFVPGQQQMLMETFDQVGPSRTPGVEFRGAWVAAKDDLVYVLVESQTTAQVEQACQAWGEFGSWTVRPVIDLDQI